MLEGLDRAGGGGYQGRREREASTRWERAGDAPGERMSVPTGISAKG